MIRRIALFAICIMAASCSQPKVPDSPEAKAAIKQQFDAAQPKEGADPR
jgi:hypothetical protein